MAFVWGSMWTPCLPLPQEWDRQPCPVQWVWGRRLASSSNLLLTCRSDRYGHAISCLDRLISSKGDYFPSAAFPHISLSFSTATPRCSDSILPNSYQQGCCNMDKANTCYSMGSSHCDYRIAGISPGFQLDALRLSAACCYVISRRRQIDCGTLITTQSKV